MYSVHCSHNYNLFLLQAAVQFGGFFNKYIETQDDGTVYRLSLLLRFEEDNLDNRLISFRDNDMKFFHGFFGPDDARRVLCRVRTYVLLISKILHF